MFGLIIELFGCQEMPLPFYNNQPTKQFFLSI